MTEIDNSDHVMPIQVEFHGVQYWYVPSYTNQRHVVPAFPHVQNFNVLYMYNRKALEKVPPHDEHSISVVWAVAVAVLAGYASLFLPRAAEISIIHVHLLFFSPSPDRSRRRLPLRQPG